ncbi:TonB-dependent receptor [Novosphingobium umbonatum]|uniref:TonB-dependent receptor n=1 Tax=Novosphingobium umbonatum TaxID=1908524 RepID=A0A3S2V7V4_9SPHN|nr:TonB-dependent receptor [Novosphingobium umbonatum]RVU05870.1 TonB-dependent receptor [Novosphingobium umbonatum]
MSGLLHKVASPARLLSSVALVAIATTPLHAAEAEEAASEIIVTGTYAKSLEKAAELKRKAPYALDAVNAEDIGRFPTRNASDALQLVTGVTVEKQRGTGLYVSVRGLGPQFQNTQLNGRTIAVNDLIENGGARGRQFRFEVLPADLVSQIEVVKTPTADMDDGALGGNINIRTFKPLELGKKVAFSLRGFRNDVAKKGDVSFSTLGSWKNDAGTFGVLASAMVEDSHVRTDRLYQVGWNLNKFTSVLGSGYYTPSRTRSTIETEHRRMASGTLALQFKPNPTLQTDIDVLVTRLDVAYDEFGMDIYPDDTTFRTPTFVAGSQQIVGDTVQGGTINNVRFMASRETSYNRHDLTAFGLTQKWTPGALDVKADFAYSRARSYHPDGRATTRNRLATYAPLTYSFGNGYKALPTLTTTTDLTNPANFVGQAFDYTLKDSRDTDLSARLDAGYKLEGAVKRLAFGAEYHHMKRDYRRRDWVLNTILDVPLSTLGSSYTEALPYNDFFSNLGGNLPRTWVNPSDTTFYANLYTPTIAAQAPSTADLRNSFVVDQKITGAYARADFEFDLGLPVSGNIGIRYAHTKQVASGTLTNGTTAQPVSYPKSYGNWLPSFNLRAELTQKLILRLAASRVVNRPNVTDSAPRITVARDTATASGGNPELRAYEATQLDATLEYYPSASAALTGAVFWKKMDDYITAQNTTIQVPGRGDILLSTNVNGGDAKLKGMEVAFNQKLTMLPAPFNGFGMQASATVVDSKATYTAGNRQIRDALVGLSKTSYNLVGYYEQGRFNARLGYFWRNRYLSSIGSTTTAESYVAPYGSLDGSVSYMVAKGLTLGVDVSNLTDSMRYVYGKDANQPMELYHWGRTFTINLRGKF